MIGVPPSGEGLDGDEVTRVHVELRLERGKNLYTSQGGGKVAGEFV